MKGWVGLVGWPLADGLPTTVDTHQLQVERRTWGKFAGQRRTSYHCATQPAVVCVSLTMPSVSGLNDRRAVTRYSCKRLRWFYHQCRHVHSPPTHHHITWCYASLTARDRYTRVQPSLLSLISHPLRDARCRELRLIEISRYTDIPFHEVIIISVCPVWIPGSVSIKCVAETSV